MVQKVYTVLFDYRLDIIPTDKDIQEHVVSPLQKVLNVVLTTEKKVEDPAATVAYQFIGGGFFVLLRIYDKDSSDEQVLMTLMIESKKPIDLNENGLELGNLKSNLSCRMGLTLKDVHLVGSFNRCQKESPYLRSSDSRVQEYRYKEILFSEKSPFQYVQIVDTYDFGKMLILDNMPNLSEVDTVSYTHNLMGLPLGLGPKYKDANILILGGGDGALLKEIFSQPHKPAMVTMLEIDEMVMDAVNTHMPSVSGPYLKKDFREGPNHKIIVGDAIEFMENELAKGAQYDIIFGDLTDVPISTSDNDVDTWNFIKTIVGLAIPLLKAETGYYLTHCNGANVPEVLQAYEKFIKSIHNGKCTFTSSQAFVDSFLEIWVYYQVQRHV